MKTPTIHTIKVDVDGIVHTGEYWVEGKVLHVASERGMKRTQVGGSPPEVLAKMVLSEIVRSGVK